MADLSVLKDAGMNIDELPAEQQEALGKLDQSEVEALAAIRNKLNADVPDVSGYLRRADGNLVW